MFTFIIVAQLATNELIVTNQLATTSNRKPFKSLKQCQDYAEDMKNRIQTVLDNNDYIESINIHCVKMPLCEVISEPGKSKQCKPYLNKKID